MAVILDRKRIASKVSEGWKNQYFNLEKGEWNIELKDDCEKIYKKLVKLGENPEPEDVDKVIGNNDWTVVFCMECGSVSEKVVVFGKGKHPVTVCFTCLKKVLFKLFK